MPVGKLLNVKEAAEIIGVTDARVRQLLLSKEMKGVKATASIWLVPKSEAEKAARKQRRKGGRRRISD